MNVHSVILSASNTKNRIWIKLHMNIGKAAVLGAGTMGAAIAAHLANAGIPTLLLDIAPRELTPADEAKGLALDSPQVKNSIANAGFSGLVKARPAAYMLGDNSKLITVGNFTDDMAKLKDCDLVIEAVVENLEIKHKLFAEVEKNRKPGAVIASNTSGIPIASIAEPFSDDFKKHFLGVHFFNPPRYMKLVEVIPTEWTDGVIACKVFGFLDQRLGKGVVSAKDRPNFIANRIGVFGMMATIHEMITGGWTPTEVDQMMEKLSATLRRRRSGRRIWLASTLQLMLRLIFIRQFRMMKTGKFSNCRPLSKRS